MRLWLLYSCLIQFVSHSSSFTVYLLRQFSLCSLGCLELPGICLPLLPECWGWSHTPAYPECTFSLGLFLYSTPIFESYKLSKYFKKLWLELIWGRILEAGADSEAVDGFCLLACSPWLAKSQILWRHFLSWDPLLSEDPVSSWQKIDYRSSLLFLAQCRTLILSPWLGSDGFAAPCSPFFCLNLHSHVSSLYRSNTSSFSHVKGILNEKGGNNQTSLDCLGVPATCSWAVMHQKLPPSCVGLCYVNL